MNFSGGNNRAVLRVRKTLTVFLLVIFLFSDLQHFVQSITSLQINVLPSIKSALADAGDFSVWREITGGEVVDSGTVPLSVTWDTVVDTNANITLETGSSTVDLSEGGKYLVAYNVWTDEGAGGVDRRSFETYLTIGGTETPYGRGDGYLRDSGGDNHAYAAGLGIIDVSAGDDLEVVINRDDTNTETSGIRAGVNGISVLKLKDDFDYLRIKKDTNKSDVQNDTSFTDVAWDTNDEVDTGSFGFTDGSADITLKGADGDHFLISSGVAIEQTAASNIRQNYEMILTLDGSEIPGTRVTTYPRGNPNSDGIYTGTLVYTGIIQKTSASDQTLNVEVRRESQGSATTQITAADTSFAAVALPDNAYYISLTNTTTDQSYTGTASSLDWDEQIEVDTSAFSHSTTTNNSRINFDLAGDYLFFSSVYTTRTTSGQRNTPVAEWALDGGSVEPYGGHGSFNRGDQSTTDAYTSGSAGAIILPGITDSQYLEVMVRDESTAAPNSLFPANRIAVQGVELSLLFQTNVDVAATSSQITEVDVPTEDVEMGGAFVITENTSSRNVTNITITESGTIDAQYGLDNIEMYYDLDTTFPYDCSSENFTGTSTENQYGSTDTNGFSGADGTSSFNETVSISTTQAFCGYVVYDVTASSSDGDTIDISINDPSLDIVVTGGGSISPSSSVSPSGLTTARNAELTMTHYRWLNDDGVEGSATAIETEDTSATGFANGTIRRLRTQVDAAGSTTSLPTTFRLDYATKTAACSTLTDWEDVGAVGGSWDMSNTANLTDGNNSTNIGTGSGGVTDPGGASFLSTNGGLRDINSQTGSLTLTSTQFVEFEFAIEPTVTAPQGNTYCFRLSDAGTELRNYDVYAEGTISADIDVSATSSHVASLDVGSTGQYLGGGFVIERAGGVRTVTDITLTEQGTVDAQNNLSNIGLWYDLDTTAPYDCTGEAYDGNETQFGATSTSFTSANGTSTFSGSETVNSTRTMCPYVVLSVGSAASDGETIEVVIADPSTDVIVTTSSVGPSSPVGPAGSTSIAGPVLSQSGYHWRNDDGSEAGATSATGGIENVALSDVPKNSTRRLRVQVDNTGSVVSSATQYRLEYGTKITSCGDVGSWNDVSVGAAFDLVDTANLTDGNDTTDVSVLNGGVSNPVGSTFETPNGGQKDTSSQTGNITLGDTEFAELEYSLEATTDAGDETTYCFRLSSAGTELPSYVQYPELTTREKQDFYIQRGTSSVSGTGLTLTAGSDYVAPSASSSAFVRITNSKMTGAGNDTGGGNTNADDFTAYISDPENIETSFTITRPGTAVNNTIVYWEIIEFTGIASTDNEMIVRDAGTVTYGSGSLYATGTAVSGIADDSDVVVFITGQLNPDTGSGAVNQMLSTASWHATDTVPVFERNSSGNASQLSYTVVEYTGANWNIQRVENNYTSTSTETQVITPVNSITQTFLHTQKRSGEAGLHDIGQEVWLSSIGQVSFALHGVTGNDVDNASVHDGVAWVIENTQTGTGKMTVYQSDGTLASGGGEPESNIVNIGGTVDPDNASIWVNNNSNGEGTAFPRGVLAARIINSTQYELWMSDTGQNQYYKTEVVEWPVAEISIRQNYYRFYVDNNALTPTVPWPVSGPPLGENTSITGADDPLGEGERVRIRMTLLVNNATLPEDTKSFKLQFGRRDTTCSAISEPSWTDLGSPGSGAIWRGYDGTPADGTEVASTSLLISIADKAGTYEEENNSAVNPWSVGLAEDIEYDWHVEHNGAVQQSDYCFRMTESDGTLLDGYNSYPTLRTTGYTPVSYDWRWYGDETNDTPSSPLASENVAPSNLPNEDPVKLRIVVSEVEGAAGDALKFRLQYSEYSDFSDGGIFVTATTSCTATSTWCYADGGGIDNAVIDSAVIGVADSCVAGTGDGCGSHNEEATTTSSVSQSANANTEFEFTLKPAGPRVNAVYYFRLFDAVIEDPVVASSSYPSVVTEGGSLVFTIDGVAASTVTEGVTTDVSTTPTEIPFGMTAFDSEIEAAYRITVDTNGTEGYQMYVYSNQELLDSYGNQIDPISGSNETPSAWSVGCSGGKAGCFGYHAGDDSLAGGSTRFAADDTYAAFSTTTLDEIMFSNQPAVSDSTDLILKLQVTEEQPAGLYQNNLTFISVPIF